MMLLMRSRQWERGSQRGCVYSMRGEQTRPRARSTDQADRITRPTGAQNLSFSFTMAFHPTPPLLSSSSTKQYHPTSNLMLCRRRIPSHTNRLHRTTSYDNIPRPDHQHHVRCPARRYFLACQRPAHMLLRAENAGAAHKDTHQTGCDSCAITHAHTTCWLGVVTSPFFYGANHIDMPLENSLQRAHLHGQTRQC